MRIPQLIIITFLALALNGCSLIKTVYSNAPEAMHWWLDGYFNFTQPQNAVLKPALHKLHDWHRQTQLPLYIKFLQQAQHDLSEEKNRCGCRMCNHRYGARPPADHTAGSDADYHGDSA